MKIWANLEEARKKVISGEIDAVELAEEGIKAMFAGMQRPVGSETQEWRTLMSHFANTDDELQRLCGLDPKFNGSRWGMACLAYIAGNSTCTIETATATGTYRSMSIEMIKNLDADYPDQAYAVEGYKDDRIQAAYYSAVQDLYKEQGRNEIE